jgi:zinc protease
VKAITVDDLKSFWKSQATPSNAAIIVSGDFTKADLQSLLEKSFGTWPKADAPPINVVPPTVERRLVLIDAPGAQQTQLRAAIPGPARNTPDYEPLLVMNEILGGAFSSRINLNLRERNGFTYGAYARMRALAHGGWFVTGSPVRDAVTERAAVEMVKEIRGMSDVPVTEQEMTLAKSALVRTLPSYFETTSGTVSWLSEIPIYNLSLDYYTQFTKKVDAVPAARVQEVAKKYLLADKMIVIAVGDPKHTGGLKNLGLGAVEVRDKDGNVK